MASAGDFGYEAPKLDEKLDHDDDDDDEQEVNRTRPFQPCEPVGASTPYYDGETIEMQTWQQQSRLPDTSYEETPLLGDLFSPEKNNQRLKKPSIKKRFPKVDLRKLGPIGFGKKSGNESFIVSFGPMGGEPKNFQE